jgi:aspartate racemase
MKTLGMIGGSSWVSTADYYRRMNLLVNERLGGHSSAKILLHSMNMQEFYNMMVVHDFDSVGKFLTDIAQNLEKAGAGALVIAANTPHIVAPYIKERLGIPIIHIVEETAAEIKRRGISKVLLLGTNITMENGFYQDILTRHGIETMVPAKDSIEFIHNSIFTELGSEIFSTETKKHYQEIINESAGNGAGGVILGCTEIPLLIKPGDSSIPTFDTTMIHVKAAVDWMLG